MSKNFPIKLTFKAVDGASKELERINQKYKKQFSQIQVINRKVERYKKSLSGVDRAAQKIGKTLKGVGTSMTLGLTAPAIALGASGVKAFGDFEAQMMQVKGLLDNDSFKGKTLTEGFANIQKGAKSVLRSLPVEMEAVNKSIFDSISAGVAADKAVDFTRKAGELAVAGGTQISVATDGMTSAMNAWGLKAKDAGMIASTFFASQVKGKTTIQELAQGIGQLASNAAGAGLGFRETMAGVSALTTGGMKTEKAYTSLKAVISNVQKPTKSAAEEAERLGIKFNATALRSMGLKKFLDQITKSGKANDNTFAKLFGSVEALGAAQALTGKQSQSFADTLAKINNETSNLANNSLSKSFEENSKTFNSSMAKLKNNFMLLSMSIGEKLAPVIVKLSEKIISFGNYLDQNPGFAKFLGWSLGIAAAIGPVLIGFGLLAGQLTNIITFITIIKGSGLIGFFGTMLSKLALIGPVIAKLAIGFKLLWSAALAPLAILAAKVAVVVGVLYAIGKAVEWVASLFGVKLKVIEPFVELMGELYDLLKVLGKSALAKFGIEFDNTPESIASGEELGRKSYAMSQAAKDRLNQSKIEKIQKYELTVLDQEGNVRDIVKVGESEKLISNNIGPIMGGV